MTPGVPAELVGGKDLAETWVAGTECLFTGTLEISHESGETINGTILASGKLIFPNSPKDLDTSKLNYTVSIEED